MGKRSFLGPQIVHKDIFTAVHTLNFGHYVCLMHHRIHSTVINRILSQLSKDLNCRLPTFDSEKKDVTKKLGEH